MSDIKEQIERMMKLKAGIRNKVQAKKTRPEGDISKRDSSALRRIQNLRNQFNGVDKSYLEPAKSIPIIDSCDVLVVGAGPAGLSAAVAAARAGADTMLIERFGCFGGVISTVGMETLGWYRYEGTQDCSGIGIEMEKMAARMNPNSVKFAFNDSECLDAEMFKIVADQLVNENGIRPLLHTFVVDAIMEGKIIKGVVVECKSGRMAIEAKRVIDCSGDADVAYFAGAQIRQNKKKDAMGMTPVFNTSGVNSIKFKKHIQKFPATYADWSDGEWKQETTGKENGLKSPYLSKEFKKAQIDGVSPTNLGREGQNTIGGTWSGITDAGEATNLNLVHLKGFDPLNVRDLTQAEMLGRKNTLHALAGLQHAVPGFELAKIRNFGMTIGVRDSRKIIGEYNLTRKDVLGQGRFIDSIGIFPEFVDGYNILVLPTSGRYFHVPYRCMVSPDVSNLLVAGRCVSGDNTSHAAMRNMMACCVTGQGAGVAAAISIREKTSTNNVNIIKVQEELKNQGVRIK
jgi:ribulose 1,5-bisphosphate synthetase/thiazole synthase